MEAAERKVPNGKGTLNMDTSTMGWYQAPMKNRQKWLRHWLQSRSTCLLERKRQEQIEVEVGLVAQLVKAPGGKLAGDQYPVTH